MRNFRNFFYRLDLLRYICIGLILPESYVFLFTPIGVVYVYIFAPLFVLLLVGIIVPLLAPTEDMITKTVSENHKNFLSQAAKLHEKPEESASMLDGYAPIKTFLRRKVGTRAVYPVCRTVVFIPDGNVLYIDVKDTPLLGNVTGETVELSVTADSKLRIKNGKYDEKSKAMSVEFSGDGKEFTVLIGERFKLKEIVDKYRKFIESDDVTA